MIVNFEKRVVSVVIVRIDNGKRLFHNVFAAVNRVPRAERLLSARGQYGSILQYVFYGNRFRDAVADEFFKIFLHIFAHDKYNFIESGFFRVVHRKIQNPLAVRRYRLGLFQPPEAAAHARRHHYKRSFHNFFYL